MWYAILSYGNLGKSPLEFLLPHKHKNSSKLELGHHHVYGAGASLKSSMSSCLTYSHNELLYQTSLMPSCSLVLTPFLLLSDLFLSLLFHLGHVAISVTTEI